MIEATRKIATELKTGMKRRHPAGGDDGGGGLRIYVYSLTRIPNQMIMNWTLEQRPTVRPKNVSSTGQTKMILTAARRRNVSYL